MLEIFTGGDVQVEDGSRNTGKEGLAIQKLQRVSGKSLFYFFTILLSKRSWNVEEASLGCVKEKPVQALICSTFFIRIIFCFYYSSTDAVEEGYKWFHFAMKP